MPPVKIATGPYAASIMIGIFALGLSACSSPSPEQGRPKLTDQVELSWEPPAARADGTGIAPEDLGGYKIYYGTSPDSMNKVIEIEGGGKTKYVIDDLPPHTYYFAITAYDRAGKESTISEVVSKTIAPSRGSPQK